jgi:ABC-type branched-subunit amino acid transport system permease subunit
MRPLQDNMTPAIPFLVLFAVLVFVPSIRRAKDAADPLAGVDPPPPSIGTMTRDPRRVLVNRIVGAVVLLGIGAVVLTEADQVWLFLITQAVVLATIFLSITVITGMAGQISLCQGAFAAIGAFSVFQLVERYDMAVLPAAFVGGAIAAVAGAVLSLPIRRLGGVWTAIATLAFAYFFDSVVVKLPFVGGGETSLLQGTVVARPVIGPFDLANDKSFLVFAVVVLAIISVLVVQLRSGTFGRTAVALRGSEIGAQSIGISPGRVRLVAFALSAFIAAFGGALLAMQQENVNYGTNFSPFSALFWLVIVVTLGCRTVTGAVQAAGAFALFEAIVLKGAIVGWILRSPDRIPGVFPISPKWTFILFGLGAIQFARHPEGIVEYNLHRKAVKAEQRRSARAAGASEAEPDPGSAEMPTEDRAGEPVP